MYHHYIKVAVGQLRQQIELNKELVEKYLLDEQTSWNTVLIHTPNKEKQKIFTCRKGCCRFVV